MMIFRVLLFGGVVAVVFTVLWFLFGRRAVKHLHLEDKPDPNTIEEMKMRRFELEVRKAELYAKKKALEDAQKRLGIAKESVAVTEDIAQTELRLKRTEDRLESLDRVISQQLHTG